MRAFRNITHIFRMENQLNSWPKHVVELFILHPVSTHTLQCLYSNGTHTHLEVNKPHFRRECCEWVCTANTTVEFNLVCSERVVRAGLRSTSDNSVATHTKNMPHNSNVCVAFVWVCKCV